MAENRFNQTVLKWLCEAGWFEGRDASGIFLNESCAFELLPSAVKVLSEFYGLKIGKLTADFQGTRDVLVVGHLLMSKVQLDDCIEHFGKSLTPVGYLLDSACYLMISETGEVFLYSLLGDSRELADSFDEALRVVLLGF